MRRGAGRLEGRRHRHGLPLRALEELWEHLVPVLGREHPREVDDAGDAQPAISKGLDDLRESLYQLRSSLPVVRRALGHAELAVEEVEQARVPELQPPPALVEIRQSDQELRHGPLLAVEEVSEPFGQNACMCHGASVAPRSDTAGSEAQLALAQALEVTLHLGLPHLSERAEPPPGLLVLVDQHRATLAP